MKNTKIKTTIFGKRIRARFLFVCMSVCAFVGMYFFAIAKQDVVTAFAKRIDPVKRIREMMERKRVENIETVFGDQKNTREDGLPSAEKFAASGHGAGATSACTGKVSPYTITAAMTEAERHIDE